jgi:F0F1-type ATP synthase epsilon subunit
VQVADNKVSILSDIAELGDQIDRTRAAAAKERAEAALRGSEADPEAEAALSRANARLNASGGISAAAH